MKTDKENTEYEAHKVGSLGEKIAAKHLKKNKYRIIGQNVHCGKSEIDIIAIKDDTLVFAEVKTRSYSPDSIQLTRPADAVNKSKMTYLIRGADMFCSQNGKKYADYYKRFDIIEVYLEKSGTKYITKDIRHFENTVRRGR